MQRSSNQNEIERRRCIPRRKRPLHVCALACRERRHSSPSPRWTPAAPFSFGEVSERKETSFGAFRAPFYRALPSSPAQPPRRGGGGGRSPHSDTLPTKKDQQHMPRSLSLSVEAAVSFLLFLLLLLLAIFATFSQIKLCDPRDYLPPWPTPQSPHPFCSEARQTSPCRSRYSCVRDLVFGHGAGILQARCRVRSAMEKGEK